MYPEWVSSGTACFFGPPCTTKIWEREGCVLWQLAGFSVLFTQDLESQHPYPQHHLHPGLLVQHHLAVTPNLRAAICWCRMDYIYYPPIFRDNNEP